MKHIRPSTILHNARVHSLAPDHSDASALAISGETILDIGTSDEILPLAAPDTQSLDLGGRAVIPGLVDAHIHLDLYAQSLIRIDCETPTLRACLDRLADRAGELPPGTWILGHGWNQNTWGRYGTVQELDAAVPQHPVFLTAKSLHAAWANTAALRAAHLQATSPDPPSGRLGRDSTGQLDGLLFEAATHIVQDCLPAPTPSELVERLAAAQGKLWEYGITAIHDFDGPRCLTALQTLREEGRLGLRVLKHLQLESLQPALDLGLRSGFGDDWLRIGNVKLFADGALGPRTAAMIEEYDADPGNRGELLLDVEAITEIGLKARAGGLGLAVHAIGDLANHHVIEAFLRIQQRGRAPRLPYRIEHLQLLHPEDFARLAGIACVASMQPIHAPSDSAMADRHWGARTAHAYAWRRLHALGLPLAFGSDAPVENPNPFWGLHAAVTRIPNSLNAAPWHPEQALDLQSALRAYTYGPAVAAGMAGRQGVLLPGSLADLVVLDEDPFLIPPDELRELQPVGVMVGGDWRHRRL